MRIGILETGRSREALHAAHGSYIDMFRRLFAEQAPEITLEVFAVLDDQFPASVDACDGWLITGSRHGVYEGLPWMLRLQEFLRQAVAAERPVVGICFGHQILAEALGGKVRKSEKGWGIAVHQYQVDDPRPWMDEAAPPTGFRLNAMHQDQVQELPPSAQVLASSDFCPHAALRYPSADGTRDIALSFQAHPEFTPAYERDLIHVLSGGAIPAEQASAAEQAVARGDLQPEQQRVAGWIVGFLRQACPQAQGQQAEPAPAA